MGLIETSHELCKYAFRLRSENDTDFLFFRSIDSQTDHLPVGRVREEWAKDALFKKDEEVLEIEALFKDEAIIAANRLIEKFKTAA
jgi:hypothetical protein